jgi:nucleoside-diphosphate-sugar epimerase
LFQGIISQYAVSILDQQTIVVPNLDSKMMYIDAQDIAEAVVESLSLPLNKNRRIPLITNENWTPSEIIEICENYSGQKAKTLYTPNAVLKVFSSIFKSFQWSWSLAEQLTFVDSISTISNQNYISSIDTSNYNTLKSFLKDYFSVMLKKLKELNIKKSESPIF